jgi:RNA polymerase sigma factor (sigma-70 family)
VSTVLEHTEEELIAGCLQKDLRFQKLLYKQYYGLCLGVCLRYSDNREEAAEILNDGFMKAFTNLHTYTPEKSFKGWLRRIMVNTSIDHFRRNVRHSNTLDLVYAENELATEGTLDQISAAEILELVQQLPPSYRVVFNLHVIEGYSHPEIAEKLNISEGASKSNLHKARLRLQKMISNHDHEQHARYAK